MAEPADESQLPQPQKAPADFPQLHDLEHFNERLDKALERLNTVRPYKKISLGQVDGKDIFLVRPEALDPALPNILSAGGFHGEEPAGPWGILEFLETAEPEVLAKVNFSFLPLVNPTGFAACQRFNSYGENPNRGFIGIPPQMEADISGNNLYPSKEGLILLTHLQELLELAQDGFITQHEDWRLEEGFVFVNERAPMPSPFAAALRDTVARHFNLVVDGGGQWLPDAPVKDGIWHNDLDGSFESLLFFYGVPLISTTETPGQKPARARIECNRELTETFARFAGDRLRPENRDKARQLIHYHNQITGRKGPRPGY